jgi:hypothetical protein
LIVVSILVFGSLLVVAGAQAYMTQQQVRLSQVQSRLSALVGEHHDEELRVAQLSNPAHVVRTAQGQGLTVPSQVTDIPLVTIAPPTAAPSAGGTPTGSAASGHRGAHARASGAGGK